MIGRAGRASCARRLARAFLDQTRRAGDVQRELLLEQVARHADSQFGRDHHFREIRTPDDFRRRVPIGGYDRHEPYIDRVRQGDTEALFGRGTEVLMFAMTSGTTNRPKTIPVTRESLRDYREGWTIWGILAFDAHPEMLRDGLRPILQIASDWRESFTPAGIPCGAITGLTAHMQNPLVRTRTACRPCGSRIKDIESKYYVALRFSVHRDLGTIIAANPSTILAMARLGDREKETLIRDLPTARSTAKWDDPAGDPPGAPASGPRPRRAAAAAARAIVERTGRLLPQGLLAQPPVPVQLDGRHDGGLSPRLSRVLRRRPGPRRRADRLGRTDDDPDRGRHARRRPRHPPPLLRVHPRRPGRRARARDRRGHRPDRGPELLHRADHRRAASTATTSPTWSAASAFTARPR